MEERLEQAAHPRGVRQRDRVGPRLYGVEAASRRFFGIPASRLDARQAGLLAAVLPDPLRRNAGAPTAYVERRGAMIARRAARVRLPADVGPARRVATASGGW